MIRKIEEYLRKPYPADTPLWKVTLIACTVVFIIFAAFEPFGIGELGLYKWFFISAFILVSAIAIYLVYGIFLLLLGEKGCGEANWTIGKNILLNMAIVGMITIGIYFLLLSFFIVKEFTVFGFIGFFIKVLSVSIFPIGLLTLLTANRYMAKHIKVAESMNNCITNGIFTSDAIQKLPRITLPDGLKDTLEIEPDKFMLAEADGNYVKIIFYGEGKTLQRSLRVTMKQVGDAFFDYPFIQKCHRAFFVNLQYIEKIKGNSQGYRLVLKGWAEEIPVSRAYTKAIREKVFRA